MIKENYKNTSEISRYDTLPPSPHLRHPKFKIKVTRFAFIQDRARGQFGQVARRITTTLTQFFTTRIYIFIYILNTSFERYQNQTVHNVLINDL